MWIDSHIHIYDVSREGVSWPTPANPTLYRNITPEDFIAAASEFGINRAIAIECASEIENNLWTLENLKEASEICAVTGYVEPCSENFKEVYDQYAAYPKFRGIRIGSWSGYENNALMDKNIGYLEGKQANVVDILGIWSDIIKMEGIIGNHPGISFVIDHIAGYTIEDKEVSPDYLSFLHRMSEYKNVYMKVSGLLHRTEVEPIPSDVAFYAPVLDSIYNAFGEDRCIYGSDWPVISVKGSYEINLNIILGYFSQFGTKVLDKVMGRNAASVYKISE